MTERLSRHAALHPKRMLAVWSAIFALSVAAIALLLPSAITTDATVTNDPESEQGYDALFRHLPPSDDFVNEVVLARAPGKDVTTDRPSRLEIERLAAALQATGRTFRVRSYYDDEDPSLISPDRDAVAITIGMGPDAEEGITDVIDVVRQADGGLRRAPARLRRRRRGTRADPARDRGDRLRAGTRRRGGADVGGLHLRRQHAHRDGARARRRLRPLRRQPLPGGANARRREGQRRRGDWTHGQSGGPVQRDRLRDRHDGDAARAGHDPAQPRSRSGARRADRRRRGDDAAAGGPLPPRRPRRRGAAAVRRPRLRRGP